MPLAQPVRTFVKEYLQRRNILAFLSLWIFAIAVFGHAHADMLEGKRVHSLPPDVADKLRSLNREGQRSSCHESNIFVHGYEYLDLGFNRIIWFLGAPDYLCNSNSFVPAIVDSNGDWTIGSNAEESWSGTDLLDGVPVRFAYDAAVGMFLVTEWQIEAPGNRMYFSRDGIVWTPVTLPPVTRKNDDQACCHSAPIQFMCVAVASDVYVEYAETNVFETRTWLQSAAEAFADKSNWRVAGEIPATANCSDLTPRRFIPRVLREKTRDGAIFDTSYDWAVRIPGPTK